jgi:hypothetical protein
MSIYYKIKAYLEKDFKLREEVSFENDDGTITITYWNEESLGKAKPTLEQLDALSSQAETLENNDKAIANRQKEYGSTIQQLEYIVEHGVSAFIEKQNLIKTKYPKESE